MSDDRITATKAVAGDGRNGIARELPAGAKCSHCTRKIKDDDVVLRIAPGGGVKVMYVLEGCVLDMIAAAKRVSDPAFERYRAQLATELQT